MCNLIPSSITLASATVNQLINALIQHAIEATVDIEADRLHEDPNYRPTAAEVKDHVMLWITHIAPEMMFEDAEFETSDAEDDKDEHALIHYIHSRLNQVVRLNPRAIMLEYVPK